MPESHDHTSNRRELDPALTTTPREGIGIPPERPETQRVDSKDVEDRVTELVSMVGGDPATFDGKLIHDLISTSLKLIPDGRETGDLKLMTAALKELRYAYRVFGQYPEPHKATIFGSARTAPEHPDYIAARELGRLIAQAGWMVITGAGDGIMKAGHEGPGRAASFGVAIRLPFETTANDVIAGDEKLIHFRYFFTRKLMFLSQAEAVVLMPGGFGTMDEAYETLTLVQTGKASPIPIVMLEGEGGSYWDEWESFVDKALLKNGMISPEDKHLYYRAHSPEDAAQHLTDFYRVYHSSRYVRDDLVIRLQHRIRDEDVVRLGSEFSELIKEGTIVQRGAYEVEDDHVDLPRLAFTHTRHKFGLIRKLIDEINACEPAGD